MSTTIESNQSYHYKTIERIQTYPVVNDSLVLALNYYRWLKSKNAILDSTLTYAETKAIEMKDKTEKIANGNLQNLDYLCDKQLEKLECSYPIILEPTKTIANDSLKAINDRVQPYIGRSVDYVSSTVKSSVNAYIPERVVNTAEKVIDTYIPDINDGDSNQENSESTKYDRIKRMSLKTQKKVYKATLKEIDYLYGKGMEKLDQIHGIVKFLKASNLEDISMDKEHITGQLRHYSEELKSYIHLTTNKILIKLSVAYVDCVGLMETKLSDIQRLLESYLSEDCSENKNKDKDKVINQLNELIEKLKDGMDYTVEMLKRNLSTQQNNKVDESDNENESQDENTRPSVYESINSHESLEVNEENGEVEESVDETFDENDDNDYDESCNEDN